MSNNCTAYTLAGLVQDCLNSKGGIRKVFIATEDPMPSVTDGAIDLFMNKVDWYEYNFKKNTGSFTSTLNVDPANSVNFVSTELTLQFNKMNTVKRVEMAALAVNEMYVIIQDCNNTYWYLGADEACTATGGSATSGQNKSDGNYYQIVITDESKTWPFEVLEEAVPGDIPIESVAFTQNPRTVPVGAHTIGYSVTPVNATEKYKIYSGDPTTIKVNSYSGNICNYEALKTGTTSLTIESLISKKRHSVNITVTE